MKSTTRVYRADSGIIMKNKRLAAGLSVRDLARKTGYSIPFIRRIENGLIEISEPINEKYRGIWK